MVKLFEMLRGRRTKEPEPIFKEPTFEDLINALPNDDLKNEMRDLAKEVSGEGGPPTDFFKGNYDDLLPKQRKYNDLLLLAKKEYFGVAPEGWGA